MINGTDPTTGNASRIFSLQNNEGRDAVITGLTLANGAADTGGCISLTGASPTISNCIFLQCNATTGVSLGGAIYAFGNPAPGPIVQDSQFIYNWGVEGAAIYVGGASAITVTGCFFDWGVCPTATGRGGALCVVLGNATVSNCSMQNSIVGFGGGGIMLERAAADVTNITAYNNTAGNFGGAFLLFGAEMRISNSNVTGVRFIISLLVNFRLTALSSFENQALNPFAFEIPIAESRQYLCRGCYYYFCRLRSDKCYSQRQLGSGRWWGHQSCWRPSALDAMRNKRKLCWIWRWI